MSVDGFCHTLPLVTNYLPDDSLVNFLFREERDTGVSCIMAFLISQMGLPLAAIWLLGKVQSLKFAIQDRVYG